MLVRRAGGRLYEASYVVAVLELLLNTFPHKRGCRRLRLQPGAAPAVNTPASLFQNGFLKGRSQV